MATALDVLNIARSQIGFKTLGNDESPYGDWYGIPNAPYCAMGVSWCFAQAGLSHLIAAQSPKGFSYNPVALTWFQRQGLIVNKMTMQPGDLVMYDWNGDGVADHVEICEAASPGGFTTIGFNTGNPNDPTQTGCWRVHRNYLFVIAVIRPKYPVAVQPTVSKVTSKKATAGVAATATALTGSMLVTHPGTTSVTSVNSPSTTVFVAPPFPTNAKSFVVGQTNDAVWTIQKALEKAGLLPKTYDNGTMNTQTEAALVKWETKEKITVAKNTVPQIVYDDLKGTL
jgi:hypothetical protein